MNLLAYLKNKTDHPKFPRYEVTIEKVTGLDVVSNELRKTLEGQSIDNFTMILNKIYQGRRHFGGKDEIIFHTPTLISFMVESLEIYIK